MQVAVQQARRRRSHLQSTHAGSFCNDVVGSEETISSQLPVPGFVKALFYRTKIK